MKILESFLAILRGSGKISKTRELETQSNRETKEQFSMTEFLKIKTMKKYSPKYDLEERTACFAEEIIGLSKKAPKNLATIPVLEQLIRAGTSIGANYCEANGASSKRDFRNKIFICKKEAKETKYWLRMLSRATEELKEECRKLWQEAQELTLIFSKIAKTSGQKELNGKL